MKDSKTSDYGDCGEVRRLLYAYQAGELEGELQERLEGHLARCEPCAALDDVERRLWGGLKQRASRTPAPAGLEGKVRSALRREARQSAASLRSPWLWATAACLVIGALFGLAPLLSGEEPKPWTVARREAVVVDIDCALMGASMPKQQRCRHPNHLNALRVGPDEYWNIVPDTPEVRRLATEHTLRGHRIRFEGEFYERIRTVRLSTFEDRGLAEPQQALLSYAVAAP